MYISDLTKSVKCIKVDWPYLQDLELGSIYKATPTTDNSYYFIHELRQIIPQSMFVDIEEFRELKINSILD